MEQILSEMLEYRGFDDIKTSHENTYWVATGLHKKIFIFFCKNKKLCVKSIKEFCDITENEEHIDYIIIIYSNNITSFAKQSLINDIKCPFQLFNETELSFNITKHILVPKHEIMDINEKNNFLKKNNFKLKNLPRIFESDPVIKFIYGKKGDIIKITRQSESSDSAFYYRVVY